MSRNKKTQNERLVAFLRSGKRISPQGARHLFGVKRLSARIHELRSFGYRVNTMKVRNSGVLTTFYELA